MSCDCHMIRPVVSLQSCVYVWNFALVEVCMCVCMCVTEMCVRVCVCVCVCVELYMCRNV